jgi:hypothetical protein
MALKIEGKAASQAKLKNLKKKNALIFPMICVSVYYYRRGLSWIYFI